MNYEPKYVKGVSWLIRSRTIIFVVILVSITLILLAHSFYLKRKSEIKKNVENELIAIAELKSSEISTWVKEKVADVKVLSHSSFTSYTDIFHDKKSNDLAPLLERLNIYKELYNYRDIILLDKNEEIILSTNIKLDRISNSTKEFMTEVFKNKENLKLYWCELCREIHLDFIAPIFDEHKKNELLGYIILRSNPNDYLYPLVKKWPTKSESAETEIVERQGDSVLFLNELKYLKGSALRAKISLSQKDVPAVNAVLGKFGLFEGYDYRNIKTLTYSLPINGTNWFMISKVDSLEIYQPLRIQTWVFFISLLGFLFALVLVVFLIKNIYQKSYFKKLYDIEIQQRKAELKTLKSEERFRFLTENMDDVIWLIDLNEYKFVYVSPSVFKLRGFTPEEVLEQSLAESLTVESRKTLKKLIDQTILDIQNRKMIAPISAELEQPCKDGSTVWVEILIKILLDEKGLPSQVIGVSRNISERKKVEDELKRLNEDLELIVETRTIELNEALELLEQIISNTTVGLSVYNENGDCILANDALAKLIGASKAQILNHNYKTIEKWQEFGIYELIMKTLEGARTNSKEVYYETSFGEKLWLDFKFTPFSLNSKQNLLLTLSDISDRMNREKEIRDLNEELHISIDSLKMVNKELESFTYSVSHDLRAPLRAIHSFIQLLSDDYRAKLDEEGLRFVEIIKENTLRMGHLIDDLLSFSKLTRVDIQKNTVDFTDLVNSIYSEITTKEQKEKISLKIDYLPKVKVDNNLYRQVWVNLISNAIKFSSKVENPSIEIGMNDQQNFYEFFIKDNGAGFDMNYANKLFNVFQRLHSFKEFEGTGVGLAIVQRIVSRHGGEVRAIGEENKGATFFFTLPK